MIYTGNSSKWDRQPLDAELQTHMSCVSSVRKVHAHTAGPDHRLLPIVLGAASNQQAIISPSSPKCIPPLPIPMPPRPWELGLPISHNNNNNTWIPTTWQVCHFPQVREQRTLTTQLLFKWLNSDHLPGVCYVAADPHPLWRIYGQLGSERTFPIRNEDQFVKLNGEDLNGLVILNSQPHSGQALWGSGCPRITGRCW